MSFKKNSQKNPEDAMKELLASVLENVKNVDDPTELNRLRSIFRSAIPFTMRSYVASYLLKQLVMGPNTQKSRFETPGRREKVRQSDEKNEKRQVPSVEKAEKQKKIVKPLEKPLVDIEKPKFDPLPQDVESITIFFGAGKKRRFWKAVIIDFIMEHTAIERSSIGAIKLLDNYAFVQIEAKYGALVIETLNGIEHRGRKISVTKARAKGESATSEETSDSLIQDDPSIDQDNDLFT